MQCRSNSSRIIDDLLKKQMMEKASRMRAVPAILVDLDQTKAGRTHTNSTVDKAKNSRNPLKLARNIQFDP